MKEFVETNIFSSSNANLILETVKQNNLAVKLSFRLKQQQKEIQRILNYYQQDYWGYSNYTRPCNQAVLRSESRSWSELITRQKQ